jgi:hypothetical protein
VLDEGEGNSREEPVRGSHECLAGLCCREGVHAPGTRSLCGEVGAGSLAAGRDYVWRQRAERQGPRRHAGRSGEARPPRSWCRVRSSPCREEWIPPRGRGREPHRSRDWPRGRRRSGVRHEVRRRTWAAGLRTGPARAQPRPLQAQESFCGPSVPLSKPAAADCAFLIWPSFDVSYAPER